MKEIYKSMISEDLYKLQQREKVFFYCETCGIKHVTIVATFFKFINLKTIFKLECKSCEAKTRCSAGKSIHIRKDVYVNTKDEVFKSRQPRGDFLRYVCVDCGLDTSAQRETILGRPRLLCDKCAKKFKSQKRFGVDHPLQINQKKGMEVTHTKEGIRKTREGVVKYLWHTNFNKRKETFEKLNWKLIDVNFDTNILKVKRTCCGFEKELEMGTLKPIKWKCSCSKTGSSSIKEIQLLNILKKIYPDINIINPYKGWCKDPAVKVTNSYEIDIFFEGVNFGIEFNGVYWHDKVNQEREILKTKRALDVGIKLIHIWEDDWMSNQNECIKTIKGEFDEWCKNL